MNDTLFVEDVAPISTREVIVADTIRCAWCGPTYVVEWVQPVLFRAAGAGAAELHSFRFCHCGAVAIAQMKTINPRPLV